MVLSHGINKATGLTAALKLRQVSENLETILALELFCAAQGIDLRRKQAGGEKRLGNGTMPVYARLRERIPFIENDVYMKPHIESASVVVREFVQERSA